MRTHLANAKEHMIAAEAELRLMLKKSSPVEFMLMAQWVEFVHSSVERCKVFEDVMDAEMKFDRTQENENFEPLTTH